MDQDELLRHVVVALERLGLRYLVTGSLATVFYGEPRQERCRSWAPCRLGVPG